MNALAAPAPPVAPAAGVDVMVWALAALLVAALGVALVAAVLAARRRRPPPEPGPFPERRRDLRRAAEPEPEVIVPGYAAPPPAAPAPAPPAADELLALRTRVDRLEVELAALKARQIAAARGEPPAPAERPAVAPAPPPSPRLPEIAELEAAYRMLLDDPSRRSFDAFIDDHDAFGLARRGEVWGRAEADDALVIAAACRGGVAAFPGWGFVADMATSYYARRMLPDAVQALFAIDTDGSRRLKLAAAARLREGADGAALVRPGELGGFED